MTNSENNTINNLIRLIQIIAGAMILGPTLFLIFTSYINYTTNPEVDIELSEIFGIVILIIGFSSFIISHFLYKKHIKAIDKTAAIREKLGKLQLATIIRLAPLEGTALFSIISFFVTNNINLQYFGIAVLVIMVLYFPTKTRIAEDSKLNEEEYRELKKSTY